MMETQNHVKRFIMYTIFIFVYVFKLLEKLYILMIIVQYITQV